MLSNCKNCGAPFTMPKKLPPANVPLYAWSYWFSCEYCGTRRKPEPPPERKYFYIDVGDLTPLETLGVVKTYRRLVGEI